MFEVIRHLGVSPAVTAAMALRPTLTRLACNLLGQKRHKQHHDVCIYFTRHMFGHADLQLLSRALAESTAHDAATHAQAPHQGEARRTGKRGLEGVSVLTFACNGCRSTLVSPRTSRSSPFTTGGTPTFHRCAPAVTLRHFTRESFS